MATIDKTAPVMITGATGYVAGWIVKRLLDEGYHVHAPIRDPDNPEKTRYLRELADKASGTLEFFRADLLEDGSYAAAMRDCQLVFHTASPFLTATSDPNRDLVAPAKEGTRNVLAQANQSPAVRRVVLTSSCAAIYGDNIDLQKIDADQFTEEHWNTSSSLDEGAYSYSKTVAEREAWKIAEDQDRWDLVVINPSLVIGPGINPHATSESFKIIGQLGDGTMKMGVPDLCFGVVDVRDLADAQLKAGLTPSAAGRHIISADEATLLDLAQLLREKYNGDYPFPKRTLPKWLVWLIGPLVNKSLTRKWVSRNVGCPLRFDNGKGIRELGVRYRPVRESITEFFEQLRSRVA